MGTFNVSLKTLTERVSLEVVYTPKELDQINVEIAEVNRPGLFLAGYYDYFDKLRLQIMGLAEMNFLSGLSAEKRYEALEQLFRQQPPAVIVGRSEELKPFPEMLELAKKHSVALLRSNETTCTLMGSLISVLNLELAPRITRHGVLVEVYGEGILILGDSGIGKSELAIELVKRGHRLVASPDLISRLGRPQAPSELSAWPGLSLGANKHQHKWQLTGPGGARAEVYFTPRMVTTDMLALREAAMAGVGVVQLPLLMVRDQLASGELEVVLDEWQPRREVIHAVFASRRGLLPSVRALVDYLSEEYQRMEED